MLPPPLLQCSRWCRALVARLQTHSRHPPAAARPLFPHRPARYALHRGSGASAVRRASFCPSCEQPHDKRGHQGDEVRPGSHLRLAVQTQPHACQP